MLVGNHEISTTSSSSSKINKHKTPKKLKRQICENKQNNMMTAPSTSPSSVSRRDLLLSLFSRNEKVACWYTEIGMNYFYQGHYLKATNSFSNALSAFKNQADHQGDLLHDDSGVDQPHQHAQHLAENGSGDERMLRTAVSGTTTSSNDQSSVDDDVSIASCPLSLLKPINPFQPNIVGSFQDDPYDNDPKEIRMAVIGLVLVLNLAISNHAQVLNETQLKDHAGDDTNGTSIWETTLQLYQCTGQFLDHLLHLTRDLYGRYDDMDTDITFRRRKVEDDAIKFHCWMELITVHNMATIYERFPAAATSYRLYQHLFSYIVNMNYAERNISLLTVAEDEEQGRPALSTSLPDEFPLEFVMASIIRGMNILTNIVTAPAA
jgi:hypothetical protein